MTKICDIHDDVKKQLKEFRFSKNKDNAALIREFFDCFYKQKKLKLPFSVKIDREKQEVIVDELINDISVDELQEQLPGHQPRFVIYQYKMIHADRVSYPLSFIFFSPRDSQVGSIFPI